MTRKIHKCLCSWSGRADQVDSHIKKCQARILIQKKEERIKCMQFEIDMLRKYYNVNNIQQITGEQITYFDQKNNELEERESKLIEAQQTQNDKQGFLYILRTRESVRLDEPVYKIGKTYDMERRFSSYPKGSELLKSIKVCERHVAEKVLLREFSSKFTNREEFGNEYFEGDLQEMLVIFEEFSRMFV